MTYLQKKRESHYKPSNVTVLIQHNIILMTYRHNKIKRMNETYKSVTNIYKLF